MSGNLISLDPNNLPSDQELDKYFVAPRIDRSNLLPCQSAKLREYRKKAILSLQSQCAALKGPQFTFEEEFFPNNLGSNYGDDGNTKITLKYAVHILENGVRK